MYLSFQFSEFLIITEKVLEIQRIRFGRFFTKTKTHQAINFPKAPLKIPFVDQRLRKIYQWIRRDLDCVHWCKRKTFYVLTGLVKFDLISSYEKLLYSYNLY